MLFCYWTTKYGYRSPLDWNFGGALYNPTDHVHSDTEEAMLCRHALTTRLTSSPGHWENTEGAKPYSPPSTILGTPVTIWAGGIRHTG